MASGFPINNYSIENIIMTEGAAVGARIANYNSPPSAIPTIGNILAAPTFVTGGTFSVWINRIFVWASNDCEIILNIQNANGIEEFDNASVSNIYLNLKAGEIFEWKVNRMLLYNQTLQFIFQQFIGVAPESFRLSASYDGRRMFMNRNIYANKAIKILGDSISAGANSTTSNAQPYGSWFSQIVIDKYGATQDVKGVQKAVGGTTAANINSASITGWSYCFNANLVFIALGTNPDSTDQIYEDSINAILNRELVYHPGAWFILCAPIVKDNAGEAQMVIYREILQQIVAERNNARIKYLPFEQLGILPGVTPGDVHPNQTGHNEMADFAWTFLQNNEVFI